MQAHGIARLYRLRHAFFSWTGQSYLEACDEYYLRCECSPGSELALFREHKLAGS